MVKAIRGTLVECDPSVKQIILKLNRQYSIIIHDIDDGTLFIDSAYLSMVREESVKVLNSIIKKDLPPTLGNASNP